MCQSKGTCDNMRVEWFNTKSVKEGLRAQVAGMFTLLEVSQTSTHADTRLHTRAAMTDFEPRKRTAQLSFSFAGSFYRSRFQVQLRCVLGMLRPWVL